MNPLVLDTGSPPIPEAKAWLARYDGRRGPAIDLSQAIPGKPPHPSLLAALASAGAEPEVAAYGPIRGDLALREAYAAHLGVLYQVDLDERDVAITAGCNLAFVATAMAVAKAGEAVLLPSPWYFNHQMTLAMLGIEARPLPCRPETGFVPDVAEAEALIDERIRAIVLVTPNNPTGAVYPAHRIAEFGDLARRRGLTLILDETYRDFLPAGTSRAHGLLAEPGWRDHVVQLYSFSKAYGIPGHRLGAIVADARRIEQIAKVLDCLQICPARTAQGPVASALTELAGWREENRAEINGRADRFRAAMAETGWRLDALGAYFAYARHPFGSVPAAQVAERLAVERGVLALPGGYFGPGQDGHLRIAFANVKDDAITALPERLTGLRP